MTFRLWHFIHRYKLPLVLLLAVLLRVGFIALFPTIFRFEEHGIHGSTVYDHYATNLLQTGIYGQVAGVPDSIIPPLYSYILAAIYGIFGRGGWQVGLFHTLLDVLSMLMLYAIVMKVFSGQFSVVSVTSPPSPLELLSQGVAAGREEEYLPSVQQANIHIAQSLALSPQHSAPNTQPPAHLSWVATLSVLFYAVYPYLIFQNLTLNDTALFITLLHAFVLVMLLLREQPALNRKTWGIAVLGGVILGMTTLGRALLPPLAVLIAVWFLFRLSVWQTIARLLPVALVSVVILIPWMLRSYTIYGGFVAVALNSGENVFQGANDMTIPLFRAGYDVQWSDPPPSVAGVTERYERNALLLQAGLTWLREHPEKIPELLWVKFLVHWSIDIAPRNNPLPGERFLVGADGVLQVIDDPTINKQDIETIALYSGGLFDQVGRPVHIFYFGGLLLLALIGMAFTIRQWREVALLWFVQLSMMGMYLLFHPSTRYRVPTDPLLFVFAAYTVVWVLKRTAPKMGAGVKVQR